VTTSKGGRPATGAVEWRRNPKTGARQWFARLSLADGSRPFVELDPTIPHDDQIAARECAKLVSGHAISSTARSTFTKRAIA
jgi:hypothetical protein